MPAQIVSLTHPEGISTMDQPPLTPQVSEVRYAKEQHKQAKRREEERKRRQAADVRLKTLQTQQKK